MKRKLEITSGGGSGKRVKHERLAFQPAGSEYTREAEKYVLPQLEAQQASDCYLLKVRLSAQEMSTVQSDMEMLRPGAYETFPFMGKMMKHPRRHKAFGASYFFSGKRHEAVAWADSPRSLIDVVHTVNRLCAGLGHEDVQFNSALVNWYANGHEYIARHADDERDLQMPPIIATLSVGQKRTLRIRNKLSHEIVGDFDLEHGWLYVMCGALFQKLFTHEVPRGGGQKGLGMQERISITLRQMKNAATVPQ